MADALVRPLLAATDAEALHAALRAASAAMGFRYFALTHHLDVSARPSSAIRLHNYPDRWVEYYDRNALWTIDPVHRASRTRTLGFTWAAMPEIIPLTDSDRKIIALGRTQGLGQGFTVPANVPGEPLGSCSFATGSEAELDPVMFPTAQMVGLTAFEAARYLGRQGRPEPLASRLTDRERDCLLWVARGKSDWEIARILGISEETVDRHLKNARERYGAVKRTTVVVRALFDGTLSFAEILDR